MENGAKPITPIPDLKKQLNDCIGLTKREYFAGLAMQGILAKNFDNNGENLEETISDALEYADELLKQLNK